MYANREYVIRIEVYINYIILFILHEKENFLDVADDVEITYKIKVSIKWKNSVLKKTS
jgi:hypothetical protein